jgi:plasmid maintenance system killer protein
MNCHAVTRKYGDRAAKNLGLRLEQLMVAPHVAALLQAPGGWHALRSDRAHEFAGDITRSLRLIVTHTNTTKLSALNHVRWHDVDDVTVLEIVDYH